ncbi:uncharacterized protein LOC142491523 [Ascaphus truei]|uniref:uncharacterized protein LOC142491523 n=1 Tax=Ascaphus truei TaxID=8439 RepID=UPI003F5AC087
MMMTSTTTDHVKMEPAFYHEDALNLQDFAHISGYDNSNSHQGAHRAGAGEPGVRYPEHKLMGANIMIKTSSLKKKNMATTIVASVLPPVIQAPGFPEVITRGSEALKLLQGSGSNGLRVPSAGSRAAAAGNILSPAAAAAGGGGGAAAPAAAGVVPGVAEGSSRSSSSSSSSSDVSLLPASSSALNLLKLSSPELDHLLIQAACQGLSAAPSSASGPASCAPPAGLLAGPHPFLYRSQQVITQEQEGFADGFVKALADLHKQNQLLGTPISPSALAAGSPSYPARSLHPAGEVPVYTNLSSFNPAATAQLSPPLPPQSPQAAVHLPFPGLSRLHPGRCSLDEPQTVPDVSQPPPAPPGAGEGGDPSGGSPPLLSPIDLETQERIKAERKRLRNRIAASKCRKRKLERIARLEEKVKVLKSQNSELASTASLLREQVSQLKHKVLSHVTSGCHIAGSKTQPGPESGESTRC